MTRESSLGTDRRAHDARSVGQALDRSARDEITEPGTPPDHRPIPILLYHAIADDVEGPSSPWVISPREFSDHLDAVAATGARPVTMAALSTLLASGSPVPPDTLVLTFDDGFADMATGAVPALAAHGWPATLFVTTGAVDATATWMPGDRRPMLSWSAVADLAAEGIEMGAHTVRHPQLDAIPREVAESEIADSKAELEHRLGQRVVSFAYPHGYHDRHVRGLAVDAGFTSASAVKHAFSSRLDDRFALSRVMVRRGDDAATVARWACGEGLPTSTGGRPTLASAVWRQARRARARVRLTGAAA